MKDIRMDEDMELKVALYLDSTEGYTSKSYVPIIHEEKYRNLCISGANPTVSLRAMFNKGGLNVKSIMRKIGYNVEVLEDELDEHDIDIEHRYNVDINLNRHASEKNIGAIFNIIVVYEKYDNYIIVKAITPTTLMKISRSEDGYTDVPHLNMDIACMKDRSLSSTAIKNYIYK